MGLAPDTIYFVYYDDPGFVGDVNGPIKYQVSQDKEIALAASGRFYIGSIRTPRAGAPPTIGAGDGGTGAQSGMLNVLNFSTVTQSAGAAPNVVNNISNFCDGDIFSFASIVCTATGLVEVSAKGASTQKRRFTSLTLKVLYSVTVNNTVGITPGPAQLFYQINGVDHPFETVGNGQ